MKGCIGDRPSSKDKNILKYICLCILHLMSELKVEIRCNRNRIKPDKRIKKIKILIDKLRKIYYLNIVIQS